MFFSAKRVKCAIHQPGGKTAHKAVFHLALGSKRPGATFSFGFVLVFVCLANDVYTTKPFSFGPFAL